MAQDLGSAKSPNISDVNFEAGEEFSVLAAAVEGALRRVSVVRAGVNPRPIGEVDQVAVFAFKGQSTTGYFATGMERSLFRQGDFLLPAIQMALRDEFEARNLSASVSDGLWVHLPPVEFEFWAAASAQFNIATPHEFSRLVIGYFAVPLMPSEPRLYSPAEQMFAFKLDDLSTNYPISFPAYIHLPLNDKFFLYLREGRVLLPEQKRRMKERAIDDIFVKSDDLLRLRTFWAESYLRELLNAETHSTSKRES